MSSRTHALKVIVAFATLYTIWGSTYFAIQKAGAEMPPLLMAGWRFLAAGTLLLTICASLRLLRPGDLAPRNWRAAFIVGVGLMLIGNGGVAYAVQRIPTCISAVIVAITPMWLVLFDWAQRRKGRPSNAVILGIALGVAGIATLKLSGQSHTTSLDSWGVVINIVATIGWAAGSIYSRTAPRAASPVTACAMQMLAGGVLLVATSPMLESWSTVDVAALTPKFWLSWSYLVVFGSLCGFTAYIWLLQNVSAAKVGTYAYVNPVVALIIGTVYNRERLTFTEYLACTLILAGVVVLSVFRTRAAATPGVSNAQTGNDKTGNDETAPVELSATEASRSR
ncbi:MAG: EamA family transporter [Phycisphaerae bacterium]|nr:EamA family transporter [Phycisphaerae bacterium]